MSELPVISVTELVTAFKEVVETALPPCSVEGEISNCRMSPAGHWYLTLKDETAEVGAVIDPGSSAPEEGDEKGSQRRRKGVAAHCLERLSSATHVDVLLT